MFGRRSRRSSILPELLSYSIGHAVVDNMISRQTPKPKPSIGSIKYTFRLTEDEAKTVLSCLEYAYKQDIDVGCKAGELARKYCWVNE